MSDFPIFDLPLDTYSYFNEDGEQYTTGALLVSSIYEMYPSMGSQDFFQVTRAELETTETVERVEYLKTTYTNNERACLVKVLRTFSRASTSSQFTYTVSVVYADDKDTEIASGLPCSGATRLVASAMDGMDCVQSYASFYYEASGDVSEWRLGNVIRDPSAVENPVKYTQFQVNPWVPITTMTASNEVMNRALQGVFIKVEGDSDLGPESEPEGGDGDFDDSSDEIPFPELPGVNVCNAGLVSMYQLTTPQLKLFGDWMNATPWEEPGKTVVGIVNKPIDYIVSLEAVPFYPEVTPANLKIGWHDTDIPVQKITEQFYEMDFGELQVSEYWGSFLDYAPNTTCELWLPYHGFVALSIDEIMGGTIKLKYIVDLFSSTATANVLIEKPPLNAVLYSFNANLSMQFPLKGTDFTSLIVGATAVAAGVGSAAVKGLGAMGKAAGATKAATTTAEKATKANQMVIESHMDGWSDTLRGQAVSRANATAKAEAQVAQESLNQMKADIKNNIGASMVQAPLTALAAGAGVVVASKPTVQRAGGSGGSNGWMAVQEAYLTINRPVQCRPAKFGDNKGYMSGVYADFVDLSGFTQVDSCKFEGFHGTLEELEELETLLRNGVFF